MKNEILEKINEYEKIVIHRHISPDPDAMGSQMGLYHILNESFPNKDIYFTGVFPERLSYFNAHGSLDDFMFEDALIIVTDTANKERIDDKRWKKGGCIIKIDHHPVVDDFGDINWVDASVSSTSQMIYDFYKTFENELVATEIALECLLTGIIADTNRFLYPATTASTFEVAADFKNKNVNFKKVYDNLYDKSINDMKYFGFIVNNLVVKDMVAHIIINNTDLIKNKVEIGNASNIISEFNNVHEFYIWMFITEDVKHNIFRVNIRSRGPIINDIASKYGGGGHTMACGIRLENLNNLTELLNDLESRVKEFLNG